MGRSYVKHEQLTEIYNFGRLKKEYQKPFFNLFDRRQLDTEIKSNETDLKNKCCSLLYMSRVYFLGRQ